MALTISAHDDLAVRTWIAKNDYSSFVRNRKLVTAWLGWADDDAMLFFVRTACGMSLFDAAYGWLGGNAFMLRMEPLGDRLFPHEIRYLTANLDARTGASLGGGGGKFKVMLSGRRAAVEF
jgi:hypothetical protein